MFICLLYFTAKNSCTCGLHFWASFHACYVLWGDQLASVFSGMTIYRIYRILLLKYHITPQYSRFTPHNSWGSCTSWVIWCWGDYLCISFYVLLSFVAVRSHLVCQPVRDWCLSMTTFIWRTNRDVQETTQCPFDWASLFCHFMAFWGEHRADEKRISMLTKAVKSLETSNVLVHRKWKESFCSIILTQTYYLGLIPTSCKRETNHTTSYTLYAAIVCL